MYAPYSPVLLHRSTKKYPDQGKFCCYTVILLDFSVRCSSTRERKRFKLGQGSTKKAQHFCFLFLQTFPFHRVRDKEELTWNYTHETRFCSWHHLTTTTFPSVEATRAGSKYHTTKYIRSQVTHKMSTAQPLQHSFSV